MSGLTASCATGVAVDTSLPLGGKVFSVTATDNAGNQTTKTVSYTVAESLSMSVSPVSPDGTGGWYKTTPTITVQSPAGVSGPPPSGVVSFKLNGGPTTAYNGPVAPSDGNPP